MKCWVLRLWADSELGLGQFWKKKKSDMRIGSGPRTDTRSATAILPGRVSLLQTLRKNEVLEARISITRDDDKRTCRKCGVFSHVENRITYESRLTVQHYLHSLFGIAGHNATGCFFEVVHHFRCVGNPVELLLKLLRPSG